MEFDDLQKIWNKETKEPMYVLDEKAIHRQVWRRSQKLNRLASINEWGLMIIAVVTAGLLLFIGDDTGYKILAALAMVFTGGYVWWTRRQRLEQNKGFADTILGELDLALVNANYLVRFAQTFVYWFILPTGLVTFFRMSQKEASLGRWALIAGCFLLSYLLVQLELRYRHIPKRQALQDLKNKLTEEINEHQDK